MNIYILLDRSGSMASKWDETLTSINGYVKDLAKEKTKAKVTLALFDHHNGIKFHVVREKLKPKEWVNVTSNDAHPRGMTPLYDAISLLVDLAEKDKPKKAVMVVMTDGNENYSRETDKDAAKAMLDRCRDKKWQVVFLGADFDNFAQAADVGNQHAQTISMTAGNYGTTMRAMSATTAAYAATGESMRFTDEDRKRAKRKNKAS